MIAFLRLVSAFLVAETVGYVAARLTIRKGR